MKTPKALTLIAAGALLTAGVAAGIALGHTAVAKGPTVKTVYNKTLRRTVLATGAGLTLYRNKTETKGHVRCTADCRGTWPPLLVAAGAKPTAATGVVAAKLGTLKRSDGGTQVTYAGMTLYRFAGDRKPGTVTGQGVGGVWFAVATSAAGPAPTSTTPPPPTPSYTYPSDGK